MYSVAILGTGISAHLMARLCHRSGFDDVSLTTSDGQEPDQLLAENGPHNDLDTLAASQTRVLAGTGIKPSAPGSIVPAPRDHNCR